MLIQKQPAATDVVSIKLSNGDEIIGRMADSANQDSVTITKPLLMVLAQDPTGKPGIQMVPFWMLGGDKDSSYQIARSHIMCMIVANTEAAKGYQAMTSSLAIPNGPSSLLAR